MSTLEKKSPAEAGLPGRFGDANSGDSIVPPHPIDAQLPDDPRAATWYKLGYACAVLDRLELRLGIVREVATC